MKKPQVVPPKSYWRDDLSYSWLLRPSRVAKAGSHTTKAKSRSLVIRPHKGKRANFLGMTTFAFAAEEMETLSDSQTRVGTRTSDGSAIR